MGVAGRGRDVVLAGAGFVRDDDAGLVAGLDIGHWVVPPLLNGCAVFAHKHALALAHASRGGKCKERGISHP